MKIVDAQDTQAAKLTSKRKADIGIGVGVAGAVVLGVVVTVFVLLKKRTKRLVTVCRNESSGKLYII